MMYINNLIYRNNLPIHIKSYNRQTTLNQFCSKIKYLISCNL